MTTDINVVARARVACSALTDRTGYPHRGLTSRVALVLRDLVRLHHAGATQEELRAVEGCVGGVIDELYQERGTVECEQAIAVTQERSR